MSRTAPAPGRLTRLAGNRPAVWSVASGLTGQAAVVVSGPIVARLLAPEGRGHLALTMSVVLIATELTALGTSSALAYLIPLRRAGGRALLRAHAAWFVGTALAGGAVTGAVVTWLLGRAGVTALAATATLAALCAVLLSAQKYLLAWVQGEGWFGMLSVLRPLPVLIYAVGVTVLFVTADGAGLLAVLAMQATGAVVTVTAVMVAARRRSSAYDGSVSRSELVTFGTRSMLGTAHPLDSLSVDQAYGGVLAGSRPLGFYAVAASFANLPTFVLHSMGLVAGPSVAAEPDRAARALLLRRWLARGAAAGVLIVVVAELVIGPLLPLFFGEDFRPALPIARVLIVAGGFLAMRKLLACLLLGVGAAGGPARAEGSAIAAFLVFGALATAAWGIIGVAWAMLGAGLVACAVLLSMLMPHLRTDPGESHGVA